MSDIQIFNYNDIDGIEATERKYADIRCKGWVYALEYGEMVKIGCSSNPSQRYKQLIHNGVDYAGLNMKRFVLSRACVNFRQLEAELHNTFAPFRKNGTELFRVSFNEIVNALFDLPYKINFDEADELYNERCEKGTENLKNTIGELYKQRSNRLYNDMNDLILRLSSIIEEQSKLLQEQSNMIDTAISQTRYYRKIAEQYSGCQLGVSPMSN